MMLLAPFLLLCFRVPGGEVTLLVSFFLLSLRVTRVRCDVKGSSSLTVFESD